MSAAANRDEHMVKLVAHGATAVIGVLMLAGGISAAMSSLPMVLAAGNIIVGGAQLVLTYASWRGSRIGWSFAVTIDGLLALGLLFGAPRVAAVTHVILAVALIPCVLSGAACVLLASFHADYDNT